MSLARVEGFPRNFGAYLLLSSLGRGGMGEVFLAKKRAVRDVDRVCIVKTLRGDLVEHEEYVRRFLDEARIVVQLNHSNICQVYESGRVAADYFLAMEYIPGLNLKDLVGDVVRARGKVSPGLSLFIGEQICEALSYAHRLKSPVTGEHLRVIHRDVSPANVMVSFEGEVKLIDFGLAESALKTEQTETRLVMGKVAYMAPEQARGEDIDGTTDQFAAAILVYEMVTGDRFYGELNTHQVWQVVGHGNYQPRKWGDVDPTIRAVLTRALDADRAKRFSTCEAFGQALEELRARIDPRASRNALRELMRELYQDRAEAERDVIASFSDLRAPLADDGFSPPPTSPGDFESKPTDLTEKSQPKGWSAGTEPWRNSASDSAGPTRQSMASRRVPGDAVTVKVPPSHRSDATSSPAPELSMASPPVLTATLATPLSIPDASASVKAQLPPKTQGRVLAAAAVTIALVVGAVALTRGGTNDAVVDAGVIAATIDAGTPLASVAPIDVAPVDAGAVALVMDVVDAGVARLERKPREKLVPAEKLVEKPVEKPVEPVVEKAVERAVEVPLNVGELFKIVERCRGRDACAALVLALPGIYDADRLGAAKVALTPCAKKCLKAGVPR